MSKNINQETESYNNHLAFSQSLIADQFKCTKYAEHDMINWFIGDPPVGQIVETVATSTSISSAITKEVDTATF